ncbi:uncharacterized protein DUF523 [Aestuariispira insulae]|uniref:Uncharacterized protein DUF523 n=2 Tax=Aestuariispira insulae TaxID=1461337 RepID=A0A3D9HVR0_9PROT|nr:uncharacterized protein DUF523 [Aestuariispira insulae]
MTPSGEDFTDDFSRGAELALKLCLNQGIKLAVLKENSPSCGSTFIYDGQFTGTKISGQGMAARTLRKNGIRVFSEDQLEKAAHWLESIS